MKQKPFFCGFMADFLGGIEYAAFTGTVAGGFEAGI